MKTSLKLISCFAVTLICVFAVTNSPIEAKEFTIKLDAGKFDRQGSIVRTEIELPEGDFFPRSNMIVRISYGKDEKVIGQITKPRLLSENREKKKTFELYFVAPKIKQADSITFKAEIIGVKSTLRTRPSFTWHDTKGKHLQLRYKEQPVLQYMYEKLDKSSPKRIGETYKVYHHVYTPDGKRLLTKGPGGKFPHHRGLFYGFNRISYGKNRADIWHCRKGEHQAHVKVISSEAGPVLGRHLLQIDWIGQDGKPFARELRELTAYHTKGGNMIEFASRLTSLVGDLKLDGDPQHAGFQFRATQDVPDKTSKETYYVRPDGKGEPGSFRNWPKQKNHINLAFNALSIVVDKKRYTIGYLDSPSNPKPARFSERDYGRFGSYFATIVAKDKPLDLNYRIWVQEGEMTPQQVAAKSNNFVHPVTVTLTEKKK